MSFTSITPANGRQVRPGPGLDATEIEQALAAAAEAAPRWAATPGDERCRIVRRAADILRARRAELAALITLEMGKLVEQARAEVEKCAAGCECYAAHAPGYITDEPVDTDASRSLVAYEPLGTVLAVMPWNFPFWQVFRFAAPALAAGNTALLKHASN